MNNYSSEIKKKYVLWAILIPLFYVLLSLPVVVYQVLDEIPAKINESRGVVSFERSGRSYLTRLDENNVHNYYSCAERFGAHAECVDVVLSNFYNKKNAIIFWYEKKVFFGVKVRKVVEFSVDGVVLRDRKKSIILMERGKSISITTFSVVFLFMMLISMSFFLTARRL